MSGFGEHHQDNSTIAVLLLNYASPPQHTLPAGVCLRAVQGHCQLHACHQPGAAEGEMLPALPGAPRHFKHEAGSGN